MKAVSDMEELLVQAHQAKMIDPLEKFVSVETISGRANQIVEMLTWQKVDLCCL